MIRRAILRLLGAPELADALSKVADLADQLEEYKARCAALDTLAASEEARADEAERLLDREQMITAGLSRQLEEARARLDARETGERRAAGVVYAPWFPGPRPKGDEDAAPRSIRPAGEAVLRAEVASLRRELTEAREGAASCACSAADGAWGPEDDRVLGRQVRP